jgi:hypothetical protein
MPNVPIVKSNAGLLTPQIFNRDDVEKQDAGCLQLAGYIPRIYGTAERRSGTKFIHKSKVYDV